MSDSRPAVNRVPDLVERARFGLEGMDPSGLTRSVVTDEWLVEVGEAYRSNHALGVLPGVLLLLARRDGDALACFDADLQRVSVLTEDTKRIQALLRNGMEVDLESRRQWGSGLAELALQSHAFDLFPADHVVVEPQLPNGGRADLSVRIGEVTVWIECTVLSTSNEAENGFDYTASVQVSTGDPYHDAGRLYRKAFDKIAGTTKRLKSQLHPTEPSILVIVDGSSISPNLDSMGTEWALGQLLDPAKRIDTSGASLIGFIEREYPQDQLYAWEQLRHLSGIHLHVSNSEVAGLHLNSGADESHQLGEEVVGRLRALLDFGRPWF